MIRQNNYVYELCSERRKYPTIFYRIEDGDTAIKSTISRIFGDFCDNIIRSNTSSTRPYRDTYFGVLKALETYTVDWSSYPTLARISRIFGYAV